MRNSLLVAIAACLLIFGVSATKADAVNITLRQQLLPIDCVFESIDDGLGTINYLTPAECGQIIPPVLPPAENSNTQDGSAGPKVLLPSTPISARTSQNGQSTEPVYDLPGDNRFALLLNTISDATHGDGYRVRVKAGDSLFYRPLDDSESAVRSITFAAIDEYSIWWEVRPLGLNFNTVLGETERFDQLKTYEPAASLRVMAVQPGGTAEILVRLHEPTLVRTVNPTAATQLILVIGLLACVLLLRYKPHWVGGPKHSSHHHLTRP